jgi:hypothetical protein
MPARSLEPTSATQRVLSFTLPNSTPERAKQQAMLDRIDRLESFANAALFLSGEMRMTLLQEADESRD